MKEKKGQRGDSFKKTESAATSGAKLNLDIKYAQPRSSSAQNSCFQECPKIKLNRNAKRMHRLDKYLSWLLET